MHRFRPDSKDVVPLIGDPEELKQLRSSCRSGNATCHPSLPILSLPLLVLQPVAKMKFLSTSLTLFGFAHAGLRFPCSTLTVQRLDPVVEPGNAPSAHVHHIVGGNAFNASMTGDVGERATCTTCQMAEDFSNYWTAQLYFKHPTNGSYKRVPTLPVQPLLAGSNGAVGGLTVYYTQFDLNRDNLKQQPIKAFPPVM